MTQTIDYNRKGKCPRHGVYLGHCLRCETLANPAPAPQARRPGRPATGKTPTRSMRLGPVYDLAKARAERRGETITAVVERLLTEYIERD